MATPFVPQAAIEVGAPSPNFEGYLGEGYTLRSWLTTNDHKRIALLYMASGIFWRLQWIFRRKGSPPAPPSYKEASQTS